MQSSSQGGGPNKSHGPATSTPWLRKPVSVSSSSDLDFHLPLKVLKNFYSCTIESVLTANICTWFGNSTEQDRRDLQRVVRSAERIIHSELPDLLSIYTKRCKARKIMMDLSHPNDGLFSLLRSGKRFCSLKAKTERMRRSFFPQAVRP